MPVSSTCGPRLLGFDIRASMFPNALGIIESIKFTASHQCEN